MSFFYVHKRVLPLAFSIGKSVMMEHLMFIVQKNKIKKCKKEEFDSKDTLTLDIYKWRQVYGYPESYSNKNWVPTIILSLTCNLLNK